MATSLLRSPANAQSADSGPGADDASQYDFILWSGHRFARTEADHERDFAYFKDLGFTHSLVGNAGTEGRVRGSVELMLQLAEKYDIDLGLRFGFERDDDAFAKELGITRDQMIDQGILLNRKTSDMHPGYSPMHPQVIEHYTRGFTATLDAYRQVDPHHRLKLFLIGTEMGWPLPKSPDQAYAPAVEQILKLAAADGIDNPSLENIGYWWSGPHQPGGDYRIRKAIEDSFLERVPDAQFMVDPIWAVKLIHGFGADWVYVSNDPKHVIPALANLKAQTRPSKASIGVQLQRLSWGGTLPHDPLMVAELMALAMGSDKLYHWGIQNFEPGHDPYYGHKNERSPEGFPQFQLAHVEDWPGFAKQLSANQKKPAYAALWRRLPEATRQGIADFALFVQPGGDPLLGDDDNVSPQLQQAMIAALNGVLNDATFASDKGTASVGGKHKRIAELRKRGQTDAAAAEDVAELNRLLIEQLFPEPLVQTPEQTVRGLYEDLRERRADLEPAVRSTGRLVAARGALFNRWRPLEPRLALLAGIYSGDGTKMALAAAHVPFDVLRNPEDRRANLPSYRFAAVLSGVNEADYADLLAIDAKGGVVFVPTDFEPPAGMAALKHAVAFDFPDARRLPSDPAELQQWVEQAAAAIRPVFAQAGFRAYFDCADPRLIMGAFRDGEVPMLFAVNDHRVPGDRMGKALHTEGQPLEVDILIRDQAERLRVVDIDTGEDVAVERDGEGWRLRDTLPAAWYRIYAVLKEGQSLGDVSPLTPGPAIEGLTATGADDAKGGQGVRLAWRVVVEDWVGSDVQWYDIESQSAAGQWRAVGRIYARPISGPGGLVTEHVLPAREGGAAAYRLRAVSPLRMPGPWAEAAVGR